MPMWSPEQPPAARCTSRGRPTRSKWEADVKNFHGISIDSAGLRRARRARRDAATIAELCDTRCVERTGRKRPACQWISNLDLHSNVPMMYMRLPSNAQSRNANEFPCSIIECDTIAQRTALSLRLSGGSAQGSCVTSNGRWIDLSSQRVLWLRRPRGLPGDPSSSA